MKKTIQLSKIPFIISLFACIIIALFTYHIHIFDVWNIYAVHGDIGNFFCEHSRMNHLVREPINTLSNVPYLFIGLLLLNIAKKDRQNRFNYNMITKYPVYTHIFAFSCLFLFFGSTFFHASLIKTAQQLDMSGVYAISLLPIFYNLNKINNLFFMKNTIYTKLRIIHRFLLAFTFFLIFLTSIKWYVDSFYLIPALIGIIALTSFYLEFRIPNRMNIRWLLLSISAIILGITCYILDFKKVFCSYNLWIPPHAIWHVLAAIATLSLYLYLRSENNESMKHWNLYE